MDTPSERTATGKLAHPLFRWSLGIIGAIAVGVAVFEALDISVFRAIGMPHEYCYVQDGKLIWLHVVSDLLIGVAYVSISLTLGYLVYRASKDIPFHWVFLAFGLFIVSCGFTHFMEIWVVWQPVYWLSGYVKVVTATASVATAVALFPLVPKIFLLIGEARKSEARRVQIEQLNKELERFNYSVAHDLRSPLRGIAGLSQALQEDFAPVLPAGAKDYVDRIQGSATRMDALITDLLKYATVGQQEIELKPISLDQVIDSVTGLLAAEIRDLGAEIVVRKPTPKVRADATLLQVVVQNLVSNSLKFRAPGVRPRVEINAKQVDRVVAVEITDNGLGIPAHARDKIFRIFERFHPTRPGTGIGLAIVHRAIERLGGKIVLMDALPAGGTRFEIQLPAG